MQVRVWAFKNTRKQPHTLYLLHKIIRQSVHQWIVSDAPEKANTAQKIRLEILFFLIRKKNWVCKVLDLYEVQNQLVPYRSHKPSWASEEPHGTPRQSGRPYTTSPRPDCPRPDTFCAGRSSLCRKRRNPTIASNFHFAQPIAEASSAYDTFCARRHPFCLYVAQISKSIN